MTGELTPDDPLVLIRDDVGLLVYSGLQAGLQLAEEVLGEIWQQRRSEAATDDERAAVSALEDFGDAVRLGLDGPRVAQAALAEAERVAADPQAELDRCRLLLRPPS